MNVTASDHCIVTVVDSRTAYYKFSRKPYKWDFLLHPLVLFPKLVALLLFGALSMMYLPVLHLPRFITVTAGLLLLLSWYFIGKKRGSSMARALDYQQYEKLLYRDHGLLYKLVVYGAEEYASAPAIYLWMKDAVSRLRWTALKTETESTIAIALAIGAFYAAIRG